jgi:hypothetical protein
MPPCRGVARPHVAPLVCVLLCACTWRSTFELGQVAVSVVREDCTGYRRCYHSLAAWQADLGGLDFGACAPGDLVCAGKSAVARIDGPWGDPDTTPVVVTGWVTDATHTIRIYTTAQARHRGTWSDRAYRLIGGAGDALLVEADYVSVEGLQIENDATEVLRAAIRFTYLTPLENRLRISHSIIRTAETDCTSIWRDGISIGRSDTQARADIWNNVVYGFRAGGCSFQDAGIDLRGVEINVYNNTVANWTNGILANDYGESVMAKNNVSVTCTWAFAGNSFSSASDLNVSDDGSKAGAHDKTQAQIQFVDAAQKDFHLQVADTGARGVGADLRGDSLLPFADDIDGNARGDRWDAGAAQITVP